MISTFHSIVVEMGINVAVLLQCWGQNMQESCAHGDQACGTTAVVGLDISHVRIIFKNLHVFIVNFILHARLLVLHHLLDPAVLHKSTLTC